MTEVWEQMVRDGYTPESAADRLGVPREYAEAEMARVQGRVRRQQVEDGVAWQLRSRWNPYAALELT